jgi:tetratricopeptide (TPR) repeat protein
MIVGIFCKQSKAASSTPNELKEAEKSLKRLKRHDWGWLIFVIISLCLLGGFALLATVNIVSLNQLVDAVGKGDDLRALVEKAANANDTNILELMLPLLGVLVGIFISLVGVKRFDSIDDRLSDMRESLEELVEKRFSEWRVSNDTRNEKSITEKVLTQFNAEKESIDKLNEKLDTAKKKIDSDYGIFLARKDQFDKDQADNLALAYNNVMKAFASREYAVGLSYVNHVLMQKVKGDNNTYFNFATELSQHDFNEHALKLVIVGLESYPDNIDLLSYKMQLSLEIGDLTGANETFAQLNKLPREYWNWRAFTYSTELFRVLETNQANYEMAMGKENDDTYEGFIKAYQRLLSEQPDGEKSYMSEYEIQEKYGKHTEAISALLYATANLTVVPQCALRLADYYSTIGRFDEAIRYATQAIMSDIDSQSKIQVGAAFAVRGLSRDAIVQKEIIQYELSIPQVKVTELSFKINAAINDLQTASQLGYAASNIQKRILILRNLSQQIQSDNEIDNDHVDDRNELLELLSAFDAAKREKDESHGQST